MNEYYVERCFANNLASSIAISCLYLQNISVQITYSISFRSLNFPHFTPNFDNNLLENKLLNYNM